MALLRFVNLGYHKTVSDSIYDGVIILLKIEVIVFSPRVRTDSVR